MKIKVGTKTIESNALLEHLSYIDDVFKETGSFGFLNSKGLNNYGVLNSDKYSKTIRAIQAYRPKLEYLGIITLVNNHRRKYNPTTKKTKYFSYKYKINKDMYLIWYSFSTVLSYFCKTDSNLWREKKISINFPLLSKELYESLKTGELYKYESPYDGNKKTWDNYYNNIFLYYYYGSLVEISEKYYPNVIEFNKYKTLTTLFLADCVPLDKIYTEEKIPNTSGVASNIHNYVNSYIESTLISKLVTNRIVRTFGHTFMEKPIDNFFYKISKELWLSNDSFDKRDDSFLLESIMTSEHICKTNNEILEQIKNAYSFETYGKIYIKTTDNSEEFKNNLKHDIAHFVVTNSDLLKELYDAKIECDDFTLLNTRLYVNVNLVPNHRKNGKHYGYYAWVSFRQYNQLGNVEKQDKINYLKTVHIDYNDKKSQFDLHSAIFVVARLLNTGLFEPDSNVKEKMKDEVFEKHGIELDKDTDIKPLTFFCFFSDNFKDAWRTFSNRKERPWFMEEYITEEESEALPVLSEEVFRTIYNYGQSYTGGTLKYRYTIFFYESIFEINILKEINKIKPGVCENIYDCFYFDKKYISYDEVKQIVTQEANKLYKKHTK